MTTDNVDGRTRAGRNVTRNSNSAKPGRVPVGAGNKLQFAGKDPAYHYRVVNDNPGRLAMFQQAGYEFCHSEEREADKGAAEAGTQDCGRDDVCAASSQPPPPRGNASSSEDGEDKPERRTTTPLPAPGRRHHHHHDPDRLVVASSVCG